PTMYYGDEIGMADVDITPQDMRDPWEKNEPGLGLSRDPARTPMQWDASGCAGFTTGTPWLPLAHDYRSDNVEILRHDQASILTLYQRLIGIRRRHLALAVGAFRLLGVEDDVLVYQREIPNERIVVALNFGNNERPAPCDVDLTDAVVLISTLLDREGPLTGLTLRSN